MALQSNWSDWFLNHTSNDAGIQNLQAFSDTISANNDQATKLQHVTEDIDTVILAAGSDNKIMILHSPRNFGGTRTWPVNKLVCMIGMGPQAVSVVVLNSALHDCIIIVPTVYSGEMAPSMDTGSGPVCLTSRKKF